VLAATLLGCLATSPALGSDRASGLGPKYDSATASASAAGVMPGARSARPADARPARHRSSSSDVRASRGRSARAKILSVTRTDVRMTPEHFLFIGNSHTDRFGGMDWLVGNLVGSEVPAHSYDGDRETASGVTLEYHYHNGVMRRIRRGDWDVVVIQEGLPSITTQDAEPFYKYAALLDKAIRASGARTVLYMTWPDEVHPWADLNDFVHVFRRASLELGAPVAPVGVAMARAHAERPDLEFLGPDGVHTTWIGAYLAAATIYATVYERTPEGLPFHLAVSAEDAAFLQRIAWETVTDWQAGSDILPPTQPELASTGDPSATG
jgi:hypothetical protein